MKTIILLSTLLLLSCKEETSKPIVSPESIVVDMSTASQNLKDWMKVEPYENEGMIIYYNVPSGYKGKQGQITTKQFNKVSKSMTVKELVLALGPGTCYKDQGVAFVSWNVEDGTILQLKNWNNIDDIPDQNIKKSQNKRINLIAN
ncbi:hypothetical protein OAQ34_01755 [Opitutales bacterium]|jgi:hypothetical protein|nr:hypothetical protein [Opitutales bacterium]